MCSLLIEMYTEIQNINTLHMQALLTIDVVHTLGTAAYCFSLSVQVRVAKPSRLFIRQTELITFVLTVHLWVPPSHMQLFNPLPMENLLHPGMMY